MYELPTSVEIDGESFKIRENGDFRMVLHCFEALNDEELPAQERIIACLILFYEDFNKLEDVFQFENVEEAVKQMFSFIDCGQSASNSNSNNNVKLIDWEKDALLITSAVNNVAHKEIRAEKYLHWWTFVGYYMAIGDCALSNIVSIRNKIATGKKLEKYEKQFKQENPQYFNMDYRTAAQKEADEYVRNLWNGGQNG